MRLLFALMVIAATLGTTRADERLTLKLNPSAGSRLVCALKALPFALWIPPARRRNGR
jgi:hypothetical protein